MKNTDIYLHFPGNTEEAFLFYQSIFGGEFTAIQRYGDVPGGEKMDSTMLQKIMHIGLNLTPHTVLMASDTLDKNAVQGFTNFHICLQLENTENADKIFEALSSGGKIEMPMNTTFWGAYFGMCQDKFGVLWMINFSNSNNSLQ